MSITWYIDMAEEKSHSREILIGIGLVLAVLAVYLPVIWLDFTNYDDPGYVLENAAIQDGVTWPAVHWAFSHSHSANWHPVTWISHMFDCQLYGLKPAGHHLTNLLFHVANTVLLFGLLNFLTRALWRSACVAALFALHPLHVESVAWIAERKDVLSAFFGLLCLWTYAKYVGQKASSADHPGSSHPPPSLHAPRYYALTLLFFALGLMSKPMLVTWPCVLLLMDVWPLRRFSFANPPPNPKNIEPGASAQAHASAGVTALLLEKIPFFALSIAVCTITIISQKAAAAVAPLAAAPLLPRILNALLAYSRYLQKLIWPTRLSVIYLDLGNPPIALALLSAALLAAVTWMAWRLRKARPWLIVGWAWYLGTLVPVIGLVKVGNQSMADRYTYLPAIGFFIIIVWTVGDLVNRYSKYRIPAALSATGILTAFSLVAQNQLMFWQNTETLFRHALSVTENNYVAYYSLGFYLADLGETRQAQPFLRTALSIHPNSPPAWNKLASALLNQARYDEALGACEMALRLNPRLPEAHTTFALACLKQGHTNEALAHYSAALQSQPDYAPAHYNLANTLAQQGHLDQAREHYQAAVRSDSHSADTRNNLAYVLAREHRLDEAVFQFNTALRLRPAFWQAHYGLGEALAQQGRFVEAANEFTEALRLNPELAVAHFQLALSLARQGKLAEALSSAGQAQLLATRSGQHDLAEKSRLLQERLQSR